MELNNFSDVRLVQPLSQGQGTNGPFIATGVVIASLGADPNISDDWTREWFQFFVPMDTGGAVLSVANASSAAAIAYVATAHSSGQSAGWGVDTAFIELVKDPQNSFFSIGLIHGLAVMRPGCTIERIGFQASFWSRTN